MGRDSRRIFSRLSFQYNANGLEKKNSEMGEFFWGGRGDTNQLFLFIYFLNGPMIGAAAGYAVDMPRGVERGSLITFNM